MKSKLTPQTAPKALLLLAPLAMAVARRSPTLLLGVAAVVTLIQNRRSAIRLWQSAKFDPALIAGLGLLAAWATISLLWSPLPGRGAKQLVFDFLLPVACGLWLISLPTQPEIAKRWFAWGLAAAAALVVIQLNFQVRIEALFNPAENHSEAWRFNMVVVTYTLFLPALFFLLRDARWPAMFGLTAIIAASLLSQSATSKASIIAVILVYGLARLLQRRISLRLFAIVLFGLLALQPWQGALVERALQATHQTERLFQSAKERIVIWQATGQVARNALPWGTGMGSSDVVSNTEFAKTLSPELSVGLRQTHAHNAFLNVLMELGLPGLLGMALIAFGVLRTLARLPDPLYSPALALAAQVITVDLISHGAWQAWWFTAIMLGILALKQYAPAAQPTRSMNINAPIG